MINFYFSKVDKQLTEWVGVKNKPVTDKTHDYIETENKVLFYFGVLFRKILFAIWNCLNIITYKSPKYVLKQI